MDAVKREDGDGGEEIGGGGGSAGGGGGGEAADPPREPPTVPLPKLLHPRVASANQHRERHVVVWTDQEDDLLREQVGIHGTENWTSIAAQFKDKTGRQCRRRWYSYLNTGGKKGGWSQEEDAILCEAQRIFGNRWTEIAKVVSGRTDNAVKNRFTTLCKKRVKNEASSKENNYSYPTLNNENLVYQNGCITTVPLESSSTLKKIRYQIASPTENDHVNKEEHKMDKEKMRPPLAVLVQNFDNVAGFLDQQHSANKLKSVQNDENALYKFQGSFIRRDDQKISALMQQVELLGSLSQRVRTDCSEHSLENAWKELIDYLMHNGETGSVSSEVSQDDFLLDDVNDLMKDARSSSAGSHLSVRQSVIHEHPRLHFESGNGSLCDSDVPVDAKVLYADESAIQHDSKTQSLPEDGAQIEGNASQDVKFRSRSVDSLSAAVMSPCEELKQDDGICSTLPNADFTSPLQTMPIFRPFSEGNPSPKFSASERQFLLSALGLSASSPGMNNPSQQPSCKRALLHSL